MSKYFEVSRIHLSKGFEDNEFLKWWVEDFNKCFLFVLRSRLYFGESGDIFWFFTK